ncbi:hypothetical protein CVT24_011876 [Panaeolus cyanescens]|uniref:Protein kinase domain-containing protein n=1 Tax=Panaeolus cyanescens TaxID=181874 RepID=A0A409YNN4_9AGAR|nr:hypothetical protein CVT24_011876 [Panaeolus cyanescens]
MTFRPTLRPAVWTDHDRSPRSRSHHHARHPSPVVEHEFPPSLPQQKQPTYRPSTSFSYLENDAMRTRLSHSPVQSVYCPPPLTPSERLWRDRVTLFHQKGYQLRHRYQPEWSPTSENRRHSESVEDHILQILPRILDARRLKDGRVVCIKMIQDARKIKEIQVVQYFSSKKLANEPRNHVVPYYDSFQDALSPDIHFLVMPSLRRFDDPDFTIVSEVVDFVTQALEGIAFLHEHNIAHHNLTADQIMMDARSLIPGGWHFVAHFCQPDGMTRIVPRQRKTCPVRYYFVGFGSCYHFPPGQRPLVHDIGCTDTDVPELSSSAMRPYDPFKLDVFTLGNVFMKCLYMASGFCRLLFALVEYMLNPDLNARPSSEQVLRAWLRIRDGLGHSQLELQTRMRSHDEVPPAMTLNNVRSTVSPLATESVQRAEQFDVPMDVEQDLVTVDHREKNLANPPTSVALAAPATPPASAMERNHLPPPPPAPEVAQSEPQVEEETEFTPPVSIVVPGGRSRRTTHGKGYMTGTLDLKLNTRHLNNSRATSNRSEHQTYMQSMTLNMELRESSTIGVLADTPPLDNVVLMHYPSNAPVADSSTTRSKTQPMSVSLGGGPAAFLSPLTPADNPPQRFGIASSVGVHPYPLSAYAGTNYYGGSIQATHGQSHPQQHSYFNRGSPVAVVQPNSSNNPAAPVEMPSAQNSTNSNGSKKPTAPIAEGGTRRRRQSAEMNWRSSDRQPRATTPTPANISQSQSGFNETGRLASRSSHHSTRRTRAGVVSAHQSASTVQQRPPLEHRISGASDASPSHPGDSPKSVGSARSDKRDIASILNI